MKYRQEEMEANYFACALLMPKDLFIAEYKKISSETNDDDIAVIKLAKIFQVPLFAVVIRIQMLKDYLL